MSDPKQPAGGVPSDDDASPDPAPRADGQDTDDDVDAGRPHPKGSLDPELIKLSRGPRVMGPVLALSIVLFCGYMMFQLRADLAFSRADDTPRKFATPSALLAAASSESFVRMPLHPDRSFAVRIRKGESKAGHRVTPVFGSNSKLWLVESGTPWAVQPVYHNVYTGRLRRLADMPFHGALKRHVAEHAVVPTHVTTNALRKALTDKSATVAHASGDALAITESTQVHVSETILDKVRVRAFRTERHPDQVAWSKALADAGIGQSLVPRSSDKEAFVYVVDAPLGIDHIKANLAKAKLFMGRAEPVKRTHAAPWSKVSGSGAGLVVGGVNVPWRNVSAAALEVPRQVPNDAWVLLDSEHPGTYWYLLPLYVVLALFCALFLWAFARGLRRGTAFPGTSTDTSKPRPPDA